MFARSIVVGTDNKRMSTDCDERCRFTSPKHSPAPTFACEKHNACHVCDKACTLREIRAHGVFCPISGRYCGPELLNDVFGTVHLDDPTAESATASTAGGNDVEMDEEVKATRERRTLTSRTSSTAEHDVKSVSLAIETLRPLLVRVAGMPEFGAHLDAYATEFVRLYRCYSEFERQPLAVYVVGFAYMLRDGLAGVAEPDALLASALPNANDLETSCGIPRNYVTSGCNAIKAALHKMSASPLSPVKRAKSAPQLGHPTQSSQAPRAFVLSSSSSATDLHPEARAKSHAAIMKTMAAATQARRALFC